MIGRRTTARLGATLAGVVHLLALLLVQPCTCDASPRVEAPTVQACCCGPDAAKRCPSPASEPTERDACADLVGAGCLGARDEALTTAPKCVDAVLDGPTAAPLPPAADVVAPAGLAHGPPGAPPCLPVGVRLARTTVLLS